MSTRARPSKTNPNAGRWVCWLFVAALLVRTFWVPYHLATEPHYYPLAGTSAGTGSDSQLEDDGTTAIATADDQLAPHSALDHSRPPHPRPGDEEERLGDALALPPAPSRLLPCPGLFAGWLELSDYAQPRSIPTVAAAAPRAPPIA